MFEIIIFCLIGLALGYGVALWLMGRHDDVLYGHFVQAEQGNEPLSTQLPPRPADGRDSLQSLLISIKQDLKDAAQI